MTVSELILQLQDVIAFNGDIPVTVEDSHGHHEEATRLEVSRADYYLSAGHYEKVEQHVCLAS